MDRTHPAGIRKLTNVTTSPIACSCVEDSTHESTRLTGVGPESWGGCLPACLCSWVPTAARRAAHRLPHCPEAACPSTLNSFQGTVLVRCQRAADSWGSKLLANNYVQGLCPSGSPVPKPGWGRWGSLAVCRRVAHPEPCVLSGELSEEQLHFSSLRSLLEQPDPGTLPCSPNEMPNGRLIPLTSSPRGLAASLALNRDLRLGSDLSFMEPHDLGQMTF